jgi:tagaturonate reductase
MQLSRQTLNTINRQKGLVIPGPSVFSLPEKVLQFGTGVLLRGLPDFCIDQANREGHFNGRIVVVKSTATGSTDAFLAQDGLYTVCVQGTVHGATTEETIINASISRVLDAHREWKRVLDFATSDTLQVVLSNTTEVGITLLEESVYLEPPVSFPAKLLAVLHARYHAFQGNPDKGLVIVPTELITDNGKKLQEIILHLAAFNELGQSFINWIQNHNYFCNSLVDRIVPGKLPSASQTKTETTYGYTDALMIMCEPYYLWAIEIDSDRAREILSFAKGQPGIVITHDITRYKELKLRLLNGSHTFSCALALLMGLTTVKQAMRHESFRSFINTLMYEEIIPAITGNLITETEARQFAQAVQDRYRNPYLEHAWSNIALQYTSKMRMRNVPMLVSYINRMKHAPKAMATGFAAYILLMNAVPSGDVHTGSWQGQSYTITDQFAPVLTAKWQQHKDQALVHAILSDTTLWGTDLTVLPGFPEAVWSSMQRLQCDSLDLF